MSVATLKQRILNELDNGEKGLSDKIAKLAGYSSGSALRKVLTDDKKEFGKFYGLVKVVRELFPQEEKQLMGEYALTVDPNKQTARYMLEYLNFNYMYEELGRLIEIMKNAKNAESKEWGKMYEVDQLVINKKLTPTESLSKFSQINVKSMEIKVCLEIMKAYSFFEIQKYDMAINFVYPILDEINNIKEGYIKNIFLGRSLAILAECESRMNNTEIAREYCSRIIKEINENNLIIRAYLIKGNSYILNSYNEAMKNLKKGLELAKNSEETLELQLKRSVNFTNNYWKKEIPFPNLTNNSASDLHEDAFSEINKDNLELAKNILNSINLNKMNNNEKGVHYYLQGLITKKIEDFSLSIVNFKKSGDTHFLHLPLIELQKLGINEALLNAILV